MSQPPSPPHDQPVSITGNSRRRAPRDSLLLLTVVTDETGEALGKARVRNLSALDMMADCDILLQKGNRLVVELRGIGEVPGEVAWVRAGRVGMAFDREVDPRLARRPMGKSNGDPMPMYLRPLLRVSRFSS